MLHRRFKEAVNECTDALDVDPAFLKALLRRAKAYEAMGHYKQALHDYQKANKADSANPDTQEAEKRLKDIVTGKRTGNGMVANGVARKGSNGRQKPQMLVYTVSPGCNAAWKLLRVSIKTYIQAGAVLLSCGLIDGTLCAGHVLE